VNEGAGRAYEHRFHAGNVGDVLKHCALLAALDATSGPKALIETHAGAGSYSLGPTGEWTEGIGKLVQQAGPLPPLVLRYLERVRAYGGNPLARYPGSPLLAAESFSAEDHLLFFELSSAPRAALAGAFVRDPRVEIRGGDGLAALPDALSELVGRLPNHQRWVVIDPPYADRQEWAWVPTAIAGALRVDPNVRILAWYPVKSYTRPNAMMLALERAGVSASVVELLTSPLTFKKNRLNGSGLVFVHPPQGLLETLGALTAWLGPKLSAHGAWHAIRIQGW